METTPLKPAKHRRLLVIISLILAAFLAGIGGELFTRLYLSNFSFFRDYYFTAPGDLAQKDLIIQGPRKVVVQQDLMVSQLMAEIQPSVLGIYKNKNNGKTIIDNAYASSDWLGQAFVLTNDGWLVSSVAAAALPKEDLAIYYNNKIYKVDKLIKENSSGIAFLKIDALNLPVTKLADWQNVTNGQQILIYNSFYQQISLGTILDRGYKNIKINTDNLIYSQDLDKMILLDKDYGALLAGSPVFNLQGEMIGVLDTASNGYSQTIPINYISPIINQTLKDGKITRPYLGAYYLDLNKLVDYDAQLTSLTPKGAYLWAINADSPLKDKLVKGDIITAIESQAIDEDNSLSDILMSYKPGQSIAVKYWSNGQDKQTTITLK